MGTLRHYIYIVIINNPTGGHFFVTHSVTDTPSLYIYRHHQQSNWWSLFCYSLTQSQTLRHYIYIVIINNPTGGHFFVTHSLSHRHSVIIYISSSSTIQLVVTFS